MQFKKFIYTEARDIFGFELEKKKPTNKEEDRKLPIDPINSEIIMGELARLPLGGKIPINDWSDTVEWGRGQYGAIRVEMSPLGSYKATVRRRIIDLMGEATWICKKVIPFKEDLHAKNEAILAHDVHEYLKKIDEAGVEAPMPQYDELEKLARAIAANSRHRGPEVLIFEGIKKLDHNNYLIFYGYRGHGVEAPGAHRGEQFNINVQFDPFRGLLRSWGCEVLSPTRVHRWELQPSEWDEYFSPAQPLSEIVDNIMNVFSAY